MTLNECMRIYWWWATE